MKSKKPQSGADRLNNGNESDEDLNLYDREDLDGSVESDEDAQLLEENDNSDNEQSHTLVDRRTIVSVHLLQVPGFIYLQAPNMNASNELLATYLWLIPGFKYQNCPQFTTARSDAVEGGRISIWEKHHLELPIHTRIPSPAIDSTCKGSAYPPGTWVRIQEGLFHGDIGRI